MPPGWAELVGDAPGRAAASATSGSTASSPRARVDVAADAALSLWDYAAVQLLVEEAGGRCTTFAGGPPAPGDRSSATNGAVHDAALALLAAVASEARRGCARTASS